MHGKKIENVVDLQYLNIAPWELNLGTHIAFKEQADEYSLV